jgi:hypothetical protein
VKFTVFWDVAPYSVVEVYRRLRGVASASIFRAIALMMEAAGTSEKSTDFYQAARRIVQEDSELHTRRRENLKFHMA